MEMAQLQEKAFRSQATSEAADVARSERAASEVAVTTRTDAVTSGIVRNARHADASVLARRTASEDAEAGTRRGGRPREIVLHRRVRRAAERAGAERGNHRTDLSKHHPIPLAKKIPHCRSTEPPEPAGPNSGLTPRL